jgi:hypothetical protein
MHSSSLRDATLSLMLHMVSVVLWPAIAYAENDLYEIIWHHRGRLEGAAHPVHGCEADDARE